MRYQRKEQIEAAMKLKKEKEEAALEAKNA